MAHSPSVQASMELSDRLSLAKAQRKISAETPFAVGVKIGNNGLCQMFCLNSAGLIIWDIDPVLFFLNVTDPI